MHACVPSEPSTALAVYNEDLLHVKSLYQDEIQLCNLEKKLAVNRHTTDIAALELAIVNQTTHMKQLSRNHTLQVGALELGDITHNTHFISPSWGDLKKGKNS